MMLLMIMVMMMMISIATIPPTSFPVVRKSVLQSRCLGSQSRCFSLKIIITIIIIGIIITTTIIIGIIIGIIIIVSLCHNTTCSEACVASSTSASLINIAVRSRFLILGNGEIIMGQIAL